MDLGRHQLAAQPGLLSARVEKIFQLTLEEAFFHEIALTSSLHAFRREYERQGGAVFAPPEANPRYNQIYSHGATSLWRSQSGPGVVIKRASMSPDDPKSGKETSLFTFLTQARDIWREAIAYLQLGKLFAMEREALRHEPAQLARFRENVESAICTFKGVLRTQEGITSCGIVLEPLGPCLSNWLAHSNVRYCKGISEALVQAIALDMLHFLDFIHGKGIIHRDIKPQNLLVRDHMSPRPRIVFADFGFLRSPPPRGPSSRRRPRRRYSESARGSTVGGS